MTKLIIEVTHHTEISLNIYIKPKHLLAGNKYCIKWINNTTIILYKMVTGGTEIQIPFSDNHNYARLHCSIIANKTRPLFGRVVVQATTLENGDIKLSLPVELPEPRPRNTTKGVKHTTPVNPLEHAHLRNLVQEINRRANSDTDLILSVEDNRLRILVEYN